MQRVKSKINEYKRIKNFLDTLCKAYFDTIAPKHRKYVGWKLSDEYPNCIGIGYEYFDWKGEYQCNTEWVSISELEMFNK